MREGKPNSQAQDREAADPSIRWSDARSTHVPLLLTTALPEARLLIEASSADPDLPSLLPAGLRLVQIADEDFPGSVPKVVEGEAADSLVLLAPTPDLPRRRSPVHGAPEFGETDKALRAVLNLPSVVRVAVAYREGHVDTPARKATLAALLEGWRPTWLISLPPTPELLSPDCDPRIRVIWLVLERDIGSAPPLRCVRLEDPVPPADQFTRLLGSLAKQRGGANAIGFVLPGGLPPDSPLNVVELDPRTRRARGDLKNFGSARPLRELVKPLPSLSKAKVSQGSTAGEQVFVLSGQAIRPDGSLDLSKCEQTGITESVAELGAGDIVIRRTVPVGEGPLVLTQVQDGTPRMVAGPNAIALRPLVTTTPQHLRLLVQFLSSEFAFRQLIASGHRLHLSRSALLDITVPEPDDVLLTLLAELDDAVDQLARWTAEADLLRRTALGGRDPGEARRRLLTEGRRLNRRVRAANQMDDLGHLVRTQFPYPLAVLWRAMEAAGGPMERLQTAVHYVESMAALLGSTAAALSVQDGQPLGSYRDLTDALLIRGGATYSHWTQMLAEVGAGNGPSHPETFLGGVRDAWDDRTAQAFARVAAVRNDFSHHRLTTPGDLGRSAETAGSDAILLTSRFQFLTEFAFRFVVTARWDSFQQETHLGVRDLVGDQAVLPVIERLTSQQGIEEGSLHLVGNDQRHALLRPFVVGRECPECRHWATFCLDRWDRKANTAVMKALECGHISPEAESTLAFQRLNLLTSDPAASRY